MISLIPSGISRIIVQAIAYAFCLCTSLSPVLADAPNTPGELRVLDANNRQWTGILRSLTAERLVLAGEATNELAVSEVRIAEFAGRRMTPFERGSAVFLANGDRLVCEPLAMDEANLSVRWTKLRGEPPFEIPLETIRGVIFDVPQTSAPRRRLINSILDGDRGDDVLVLDTGDRLTGELSGMDARSMTFDGPVGETQVERAGVRAVGFSPELISFPELQGPRVLLALANGSILTARTAELQPNDRLAVDATFGKKLDLPLSAVASLRFEGGRIVPLSGLEPAAYEFTPYVSGHWELRRNRSAGGGPLTLRGTEYPRGLGMHSRSTVTYDLGGKYRRFHAVIGIDDETQGAGSAIFAVELDGERVFTSPPLTGTSEPLPLPPVDVSGKRRLTLIVDYGPHADIQDHADWCDAVLVR